MSWNDLRRLQDELNALEVKGPEDWASVNEWRMRVRGFLAAHSPPDAGRLDALDAEPDWYSPLIVWESDALADPYAEEEERNHNVTAAANAKLVLLSFLDELMNAASAELSDQPKKLDSAATPPEIRLAILSALYDAHHREPRVGLPWRQLVESLGITEIQFHAAMSYLSDRGSAEYQSNIRCGITAPGIDIVEQDRVSKIAASPVINKQAPTNEIGEADALLVEDTLEIIGQVDSGLYGRVFKARQVQLDRIVAVKIIKAEFLNRADAVKHAKAMARVGPHPNIVSVHAVRQVAIDGVFHPAMVMEWLDGEKFGIRLAGPRFSEQELRRICVGVLDGIERMHASGLQHGDLHFGNIILLADCQPKIIDIDATKDRSLGGLSDISREGAVAADVDYGRQLVQKAFAHSVFSPAKANALDVALASVTTLTQIRAIVDQTLDSQSPNPSPSFQTFAARPETAESVTEKVQEYIETHRPASLFGLVTGHTRALRDELLSDRFDVQSSAVTPELIQRRLEDYQGCVGSLMPAIAAGGFWGDEAHWNAWQQCIETAANCYEDLGPEGYSGRQALLNLRLYPPLLLFYACSMGAFLNDQIATLRFLMDSLEYASLRQRHLLSVYLQEWKAEQTGVWNQLVLDGANKHTPVSDHLGEYCYRALGSFATVRTSFDIQFDRFEYFLGLMRCPTLPDAVLRNIDAVPGTYLWRRANEPDFSDYFLARARERGDGWAPFKAGLFDRNLATLERTIRLFDEYVDEQRDAYHIRRPRRRD